MNKELAVVHDIGPKLIEALGLPKRCIWFELRVATDEPVTVRCECHAEKPADGVLETVFAEYKLVPKQQDDYQDL